jgi:hypothetical protein
VAWKLRSQTSIGVTTPGSKFFLNQQTSPDVVEVPSKRVRLAAVPKRWQMPEPSSILYVSRFSPHFRMVSHPLAQIYCVRILVDALSEGELLPQDSTPGPDRIHLHAPWLQSHFQ